MFHKEGAKIILVTLAIVVAVIFLADAFIELAWLQKTVQVAALVLLILVLQFFRNPKRKIERDDNHILSPVDGKVVVIEEVFEKEYFKDKRLMVSVFMSPLNVQDRKSTRLNSSHVRISYAVFCL